MKKLYKLGTRTIDFFWVILFGLTIWFAFLSPNLILGDNQTFGTSTTLLTTSLILVLVGLIIGLVTFPTFRKKLYTLFVTHKYFTASVLLILVVLIQIGLVYLVHPPAGFDAGILHYAAVSKEHVLEPNVIGYYSLNQNNLPIMLLMRGIVKLTGQTSWQFFDYLTLFLVDLSVLLNILSIKMIVPKATAFSMYLQAVWLIVFPSILMPYTDTWVMPLVSGYLLCYFLLRSNRFHYVYRIIAGALFAILIVLTYFIKPSAIIPVIAIVLVNLLIGLTHQKSTKKRVIAVLTAGCIGFVGVGTYQIITHRIAEQNYIQIDASRNIPMSHFVSMGISGTGGYSAKQAVAMAALPTKAEKNTYSKKIIAKRLKELKIGGYLVFLVRKQNLNTADGTFGWLKEGNFFREDQKPSPKGIHNKLKNFIFLYGKHIADFRFFAQLIWLFCLLIILMGWGNKTQEILILRLGIIGGFLFLLLFEGGRSRYLIQYLPCFVLLAALSWGNAVKHVQQIIQWWKYENPAMENN